MLRKIENQNSTVSDFYMTGTDIKGKMMEPAGPSTTMRNMDKRIPAGTYRIQRHSSDAFPDHFLIYNDKVPKDRGILIHIGQTGRNTSGCLLPGEGYNPTSQRMIHSSRMFKKLYDAILNVEVQNVRLIIIDPRPVQLP